MHVRTILHVKRIREIRPQNWQTSLSTVHAQLTSDSLVKCTLPIHQTGHYQPARMHAENRWTYVLLWDVSLLVRLMTEAQIQTAHVHVICRGAPGNAGHEANAEKSHTTHYVSVLAMRTYVLFLGQFTWECMSLRFFSSLNHRKTSSC